MRHQEAVLYQDGDSSPSSDLRGSHMEFSLTSLDLAQPQMLEVSHRVKVHFLGGENRCSPRDPKDCPC